ncbi:MAG: TetR/AcrR family transcriptional regulator [Thermodesulfobacteriota bacterium]
MKTAREDHEIAKIREGILDNALEIIVQEGFDALTMRRLAGRIGMTAPNIYNYFSGKHEIYISIVIRGFEMLYQDLSAAHASRDDGREQIREMIRTYLRFGMEKPRYYDIMFSRPTPKYKDYIGTPFEKLSAVEYRISMQIAELAREAASRILRLPENAEIVYLRLIHIWSLLHGMISLHNSHIVGYVVEHPQAVYDKLIDEFIHSLANQAA